MLRKPGICQKPVITLYETPAYAACGIAVGAEPTGVQPGTGTPEAGGVTFPQLLTALLLVSRTNVVGADINELAPMLDTSGASTACACKVLREMLLALY